MKRERSDFKGGMGTFRTAIGESCCELLILANGTVLVQNLTQKMAAILSEVAPQDASLQHRAFQTYEFSD